VAAGNGSGLPGVTVLTDVWAAKIRMLPGQAKGEQGGMMGEDEIQSSAIEEE